MYFPLTIVAVLATHAVNALYEFPERKSIIPKRERDILDTLSEDDLKLFAELGSEAINRQLRLEENLRSSAITVKNGSLSHSQLLETLPNIKANDDCFVARKVLKSSLFAYNTKCFDMGISGSNCRDYLSEKALPKDAPLRKECDKILSQMPESHHALRRLLPSNYEDGFYKMYSWDKLPAPRLVSSSTIHGANMNEALDEGHRNLAFVQWAQFVEHDLSKPVATSMKNGDPIDCCSHENYKLAPRHLHPACAPLIGKDSLSPYGRETCLNYVRSALTIASDCNFGGAEQLNQATGYLDLSQLYGHTDMDQDLMRTHQFGLIKSSKHSLNSAEDMLPLATATPYAYCALKHEAQNETCFMAGDSRVNSSPYSIVLYTIFMRSHNKIAEDLHQRHPEWSDDRLYEVAKAINIAIYRRIVLNEWLPTVLGQRVASQINAETVPQSESQISISQISNEFAVAAIRFYFSMMPNEVDDLSIKPSTEGSSAKTLIDNNNIAQPNLFVVTEEMYRSRVLNDSKKLNDILESLLHQRAMKMDSNYEECFIQTYMGASHPTRSDVLAFDIQRGRDHGLQGYVKYLEQCEGVTVKGWDDLTKFIDVSDINKLRTAYRSWNDVDLIVGGISEKPLRGSVVGPTFTCILGEQFSKIHRLHQVLESQSTVDVSDMRPYLSWTGAQLLCANSQVGFVPKNIFEIDSQKNPMIAC